MIYINHPEIHEKDDLAYLSVTLKINDQDKKLWYSVPKKWAGGFARDRCDGFVIAILLQAMRQGNDIVTEAPMSARLYHSITNYLIPLVTVAFPELSPVKITPSGLITTRETGTHVATGFSGGIDSFATFVSHSIHETSEAHKISLLLFNNVGSHGSENIQQARDLFKQRCQVVQPFAQELGLPLLAVDSNITDIFPIDFIKMHSALNVSVPLILQNLISRVYYASTYKYSDCHVDATHDISMLDPLLIHLLSSETLECISTGCQHSRVEKTEIVSEYEPSYRFLNVCVDPAYEGRNCSVCFKCSRTIMTLELLGMADRYTEVFDIDRFKQVRGPYIRKLIRFREGSFEAEIAALARKNSREPWSTILRQRQKATMWFKSTT